ncbi:MULTISPECIES: EpsG family protein [Enterobacterales]|uniref:EpsG family protein n=1 Tax=Enterobacterales TaxID=91347 RepID=UPI001C7CD7FA|nr:MULTISPECIES: EpsG family protein [Enterobacterales]EHP6183347.1 EpsG family protein [Escherichia coli]MCD1392266.1 EpsG family protein [Enterobacter cloacae]UUW42866.1 capsular polysaccharide biosynthesis protein [Citrobacter portucalensis]EHP6404682.1 EpsG family protein [Escherichia coli]EIX5752411.1 EpsG family protein [Escherichia coli]
MFESLVLYNFIFLTSSFLLYYSEKLKYRFDRRILILIAWLIIVIPAAIRYNIGVDYRGYVSIYNDIVTKNESYVEPGFKLIITLASYLFNAPEGLFLISSILIYTVLFLSYPKKNSYVINYIFIGMFYLLSYTFIRSYIALSFTMLGIMILIENKRHSTLIYFMLISLAITFHKSAAILLILPFLNNSFIIGFFKKFSCIILFSLAIVFIFRFELANLIIKSPVINVLGYEHYLNSPQYMRVVETGTGLGILFKMTLLLLPVFFSKKIISLNKDLCIVIISCFLAFIALSLGLTYFIFDRIQYLFFFAYILSPYVLLTLIQIDNLKPIIKLIMSVIFFCVFVLFQKDIIANQSTFCFGHRVSPYVSIFNKTSDMSLEYNDPSCRI